MSIKKRQHIVNSERPGRTVAGDAFSLFAITALRLAGHLTKEGDAIAKPAGQTSARWQVLAGARHETMSVAQIAKSLGVARQGVQRIADLLEAEGLVAYADNENHQRAKLVVLTREGRAALAVIDAGQARWADSLGAELGEKALKEATSVMTLAIETLKKRR
jgi:DNA-binding MarR family transcriptional regulator